MKNFLKKLNWRAFIVMILISMVGALANNSVHSFKEWSCLVTFIGIPFSLIFLFVFKED